MGTIITFKCKRQGLNYNQGPSKNARDGKQNMIFLGTRLVDNPHEFYTIIQLKEIKNGLWDSEGSCSNAIL
jgi:hypothetical protein